VTLKEELHRLVDKLPQSELRSAQRFLRYLNDTARDPLLQTLANAPIDEEPETEEERRAVQIAREEVARGEVKSLEEVRSELGL